MLDWIVGLLQSIDESALAESMRSSAWNFPIVETIHVIAIVLVVGSITRLDLRLLGLVWRNRPVTEVAGEMLPWTWLAFVVAVVSGVLLWTSRPVAYFQIAFFDVKLALIALAGLNMLLFQHVVFANIGRWDRDPIPPTAARFSAGLSLAFWLSVVVCGRLIGFV